LDTFSGLFVQFPENCRSVLHFWEIILGENKKKFSYFMCVCSYKMSPGTLSFEVVTACGLSLPFVATVKLKRMRMVH
jgi:hypothetical protein